jgi:hypothetical protein
MFFIRILEVLLPPLLAMVVIGYGAYRLVRFLEGTFGIGGGEQRELLEGVSRARVQLERIRGLLPAETDGGVVVAELEELVEKRLPAALERQRQLLTHLTTRSEAGLKTEEREIRRKLQGAKDAELRKLLERNLDLVQGRLATRQRLELASRKADAQIRAVLINLGVFEDRLVAQEFDTVKGAGRQVESLVEDVELLEAAYDDLQLEE